MQMQELSSVLYSAEHKTNMLQKEPENTYYSRHFTNRILHTLQSKNHMASFLRSLLTLYFSTAGMGLGMPGAPRRLYTGFPTKRKMDVSGRTGDGWLLAGVLSLTSLTEDVWAQAFKAASRLLRHAYPGH